MIFHIDQASSKSHRTCSLAIKPCIVGRLDLATIVNNLLVQHRLKAKISKTAVTTQCDLKYPDSTHASYKLFLNVELGAVKPELLLLSLLHFHYDEDGQV